MTTTAEPTYWTSVTVRLAQDARTAETDDLAPAGAPVIVQGFHYDGATWVNGVARPTYQGGGIHVEAGRLLNGDIVENIVVHGAYVASGDVIRSMLGRR